MVQTCVVCNGVSTQFSYFRFPRNPDLRMKWLKACNLENESITKSSVVCSKHFRVDDLETERHWPTIRVKRNVVPCPSLGASSMETAHIPPITLPERMDSENLPNVQVDPLALDISSESQEITPVTPKKQTLHFRSASILDVGKFSPPKEVRQNLEIGLKRLKKRHTANKVLKVKKKKRLEQPVDSFKRLMEHLHDKQLLTENAVSLLMEELPDSVRGIVSRQLSSHCKIYDPEIRAFAFTLHFYSVTAYNYVRTKFNNLLLPHSSNIQKWYSSVDAEPGFTSEVFSAIKLKTQKKKVIVNLVVGEMSIRDLIQWEGGRFYGFVNYGTHLETETTAKSALVFMAVCVNNHWKAPLGYFLITSLQAEERANLMTICLQLLDDANAECHSITFDGAPVNVAMCKKLGASYEIDDLRPFFKHPNTKEKVYTIWDPSHMVKFCRNTLADPKFTFMNGQGETIEWSLLEKLQCVQDEDELHPGTKLKKRHIHYHNDVMNVRLAIQTLCESTSAGLRFCKSKKIPGFHKVDATAAFCQNINDAFDILNAKNMFSKNKYNEALESQNIEHMNIYDHMKMKANEIIKYIKNLKTSTGRRIIESQKKTGFLGLIVSLTNVMNLYDDLVVSNKIEYILPYKLNLDHLETFFRSIGSCGECNNNPSALQFKNAYKRLLVGRQIAAPEYDNCSILDATTILSISSGTSS